MVTESALSRIRKERCQWCAKGVDVIDGIHLEHEDYEDQRCECPSAEQLVEELAGRLAEAERDTARLDWMINQSNHGDAWLDEETIWDSLPGDSDDVLLEVRAAIDAARAQKENTDAK